PSSPHCASRRPCSRRMSVRAIVTVKTASSVSWRSILTSVSRLSLRGRRASATWYVHRRSARSRRARTPASASERGLRRQVQRPAATARADQRLATIAVLRARTAVSRDAGEAIGALAAALASLCGALAARATRGERAVVVQFRRAGGRERIHEQRSGGVI